MSRGFEAMQGPRGKKTLLETEFFFDKPLVVNAVDKATRRVLSRFGAFVRRTARRSIRRPKRKRLADMTKLERRSYHITGRKPFASSKPWEPPRSQTGRLKNKIFFWYETDERAVTIGPVLFGRGDAPGVLERGGVVSFAGGSRRAVIQPRPYMGPALARELPKLPGMWRDSIRGTV